MGDSTEFVRTRGPAGQTTYARTPEEAAAMEGLGESAVSPVEGAAEAAQAGAERRRAAFDTTADAVSVFAEGLVDALSLGLLHNVGPAADVKRSVHSGSHLLGELTGLGVGLVTTGPVSFVTKGGRAVGAKAAKSVLGNVAEGSRAALGVRTAEGAGEMAALMGAASIGHQVTDAVIGDKEFSATAVIHEAGLGAIMGGGVSFLSGLFSRAASKYEVKAGGDLLDASSAQSKGLADHVNAARGAWDEALATHEANMGVIKHLESQGLLDNVVPEFIANREIALARAKGAQKDLAALDFEKAMEGGDKAWAKYLRTKENYELALQDLDAAMESKVLERLRPQTPGKPVADPGRPVTENIGLDMNEVARMDARMAIPENAAAYEAHFGRPYVPQAQMADDLAGGVRTATSETGTPMGHIPQRALGFDKSRLPLQPADDAAAMGRIAAESEGAAPLLPPRMSLRGYKPEGPPVLEYPPAKARGLPIRAPGGYSGATYKGAAEGMTSKTGYTVTNLGVEFREGTARAAETVAPQAEMVAELERAAEVLGMPAGRFNAAEWSKAEQFGEAMPGVAGKPVLVTREAQMLNNELSKAHKDLARDQLLQPDGHFQNAAMVVDRQANAQAFSQFQQKMMDTPVRPNLLKSRGDLVDGLPGAPRPTPSPINEITDVRPLDGTTQVGPRERLRRRVETDAKERGKLAVRRYLDEWYAQAERLGPRLSPGDRAADQIRNIVAELRGTAMGREVAASTTDLAAKMGIEARTALGAELNNLYIMRRVAELSADVSKGTVMAGKTKSPVMEWIVRRSVQRIAGRAGSKVVAGAIGAGVGGPLGYFAAAALANQYVGFAGRAAGATGRLYQRSMKAASTLLAGRRATFAAAALAPNKPIAYSEAGPIKDPVRRIEELHRVAQSPQSMADFIVQAAGDLNLVSPEFVTAAVGVVQMQLTFLSEMAPPLRYDQLGRVMPPTAGAVRKFLEAENAVFNLDGVLDAVAKGHVTKVQVEALKRAHTPVYSKIAAFLLDDPEKLARLERAKQATIGMITGMPLTPAADPGFVARQQMAWAPPEQPGQQPSPAQALSIPGAGGKPMSSPTPSQSYGITGRAPGN